ncbi:MAG TPA: hypothetical protein VEG08_06115 [Terriglobales bacterium]|nr:hypothetical protein [Terriglobales bacterium]
MSASKKRIPGLMLLAAWLVLLAVITVKWVVPVFANLFVGLGVEVPSFYVRLFGPIVGAIVFLGTPVLLILFLLAVSVAARRRGHA